MAISIVNKTVWKNPNNSQFTGLPLSITVPHVTAGNTMVLCRMAPDNFAGGNLGTAKLGTEGFTDIAAGPNGDILMQYLQPAIGGETALIFTSAAPGAVVLYELSPCTFVADNVSHGTSVQSQAPGSVTGTGNCAYIACAGQGTSGEAPEPNSYSAISSPWSLDSSQNGIYTEVYGEFAAASLLNTTGAQNPTFSLANSSNVNWAAINTVFLDTGGPSVFSSVTLIGQFFDSFGKPISYGSVDIQLSGNSVYSTGATQVTPGSQRIYLDANGSIPAGTVLYSNAVLSPSGSYYRVSGQTQDGRPFFKSPYYTTIVPSSASSQNIANILKYPN